MFSRAKRHLGLNVHVVRSREMSADPEYPSIPEGIEIRTVPGGEFDRLINDSELGLDRVFVDHALERGDLMFGAYDNGRLVSYLWRSCGVVPHEDGIWVKVDRPYCYSYNSFTRPAYRGNRLSPAVHLFSDKVMLTHGFTHRAGFVAVSNLESLAVGKHMGVRKIGYAGYLRLFGRTTFFHSGAVRDIGFAFFEPEGNGADQHVRR